MSQDNFTLSKAGPSFGRYLKPALVLTESSPALSPEDRELLTRRFEEAVAKNRQAYEALKESRSQSASSQLLSPPPPPAAPHSAAAAAAPIPFSVNTSSCVYEDSVEIPISTPISTSQSKSFDNSYGEPSLPSLNGTSTVTISGTPSSSMNLSISLNDDSDSNLNSSAGEKMVAVKPIGERWEKAVKDMVVTGLLGDRYRKEKDNAMKSVLDICKEFNEAAVTYMRTIVSERFKPVSNRTITIIELGGAAGGNKFIVGNEYFFKFPEKDIKIKYPSYDAAAKVAGHELKANTHLFAVITNSNIYKKIKGLVPKNLTKDTDTTELRKKIIVPPLMVLIDYLGFRAVAMTKFDLGEFIAGSSNAGANMVNKLDDNTHEILGLVSKKLNLKTHIMEGLEGGSLTWGFPFDFEMHKKGDSLYALDVSRLIPSAVNVGKFEYLYKMFRPELLQKSDEPINPDWAVKSFHKEEDVEAAKRLLARLEGPGEDILPYEFADSLVRLEPIEEYTDDLAFRMHSTGVNLRYLGMVHQRLVDKYPDSKWRCRVAVEIVARSLRKLIMEKQHSRNTQHSSGSDAALVINNLNKLFDVAGDAEMWGAINNDIRNRFVNTTYTFSLDDLRREPAGRPTFMMRITDMLGLVWYNDAWTAFTNTENEKVFFEVENPLFVYSLKDVQPRVKQMNIAYHLNAVFVENGTKSLKERTPLYIHNTIIQSFKSGLERAPSSGITLRRYAKAFDNYVKCLGAQSVSPDAREAHEKKLENMKRKLDAIYSILCSSKEPMSVYYGAVYLDENGKIEEARKYYRASIQSNSGNSFLMLADTYGFTDGELYDPKEAEEIYKRGIDEDKSAKLCNNLGILYYKMGNPENAGEMFLEAFEMLKGKELNNIGKNCAAFCFHALGNTTLRDDITFLTDAYPKLNK